MNVPTLVLELADSTIKRVDTMIIAGVGICTFIYGVVGVCGSIAFGASVEGNGLMSFPNEQGTTGGLVSIFARVAIVVNVIGGIPLYMHPFRATVSQVLFAKSP